MKILDQEWDLTFHYVSINTRNSFYQPRDFTSLHSTMFLLIRITSGATNQSSTDFTFHYVSINTPIGRDEFVAAGQTLHSTMFLLIRIQTVFSVVGQIIFTFHYVSINTGGLLNYFSLFRSLHSTMFLLIREDRSHEGNWFTFTFHYVSINTGKEAVLPLSELLYIPLCFY